jgi:uncharacterized RDD family membrane protein YckC
VNRNGRETTALSTLPNQINNSPSWKQEVNQRVAAHKDRKNPLLVEPATVSEPHHTASSRAAAAAARVAARYAKAPSYSELLAEEARAAVRAAEAVSKAAQEAQAVAESVLAGLEAANADQQIWEVQTFNEPERRPQQSQTLEEDGAALAGAADRIEEERPPAQQEFKKQGFEVRWEEDLPARPIWTGGVRAVYGTEVADGAVENLREAAWPAQDELGDDSIETVEPEQPIHANLIEFPREIVATRRVRPRLAEGPLADPSGQLSIFEVDPSSISTEPTNVAAGSASAPAWTGPEWSGIELDATPRHELVDRAQEEVPAEPEARTVQAGETRNGVTGVAMAPLDLRLMAAMVDGSLVLGSFLVAASEVAWHVKGAPSMRAAEVGAALGLAAVCILYHLLFYAFARGTPGMYYAGIAPCTFDGKNPSRSQRLGRLAALLVSVVPVGLGVMWAIFDEDHLSWHDRLSQTYLRKY